jgi:hypothetical protein
VQYLPFSDRFSAHYQVLAGDPLRQLRGAVLT